MLIVVSRGGGVKSQCNGVMLTGTAEPPRTKRAVCPGRKRLSPLPMRTRYCSNGLVLLVAVGHLRVAAGGARYLVAWTDGV